MWEFKVRIQEFVQIELSYNLKKVFFQSSYTSFIGVVLNDEFDVLITNGDITWLKSYLLKNPW